MKFVIADLGYDHGWRIDQLCTEHRIIKPKITYGLRGTDAGQAFLRQNRIDLNLVLFMENYDINRKGYHDSQDTLNNIDLDYGSAVAAIAIETIARLALMPVSPQNTTI